MWWQSRGYNMSKHTQHINPQSRTHTVIIKLQSIVRKSQWKRDIRKARGGTWRMKGMGGLGFRPSRPADGTHVHFSACVDKSPPVGDGGLKFPPPDKWRHIHPQSVPSVPTCALKPHSNYLMHMLNEDVIGLERLSVFMTQDLSLCNVY